MSNKEKYLMKKEIMGQEKSQKDLSVRGFMKVSYYQKNHNNTENQFGVPIYKTIGTIAPNYEVR